MNNQPASIKTTYTPRIATLEQIQLQGKAIEIAKLCARMLEREFEVEKVVLFGSMLYPEDIKYGDDLPEELISDIDLAIFGGKPDRDFWNGYIVARTACNDVARYANKFLKLPYFEIDLVLANTMDDDMLSQINDGIKIFYENNEPYTTLADITEQMYGYRPK